MNPLIIYLNELSYACEKQTLQEIRFHLKNAISAIRSIFRIRKDDVFLGLDRPFAQITLGDEKLPFAAILPDRNDILSVLKRIIDRNPFPLAYSDTEEIRYHNRVAVGMGWAYRDKSLILSFGYVSPWSETKVVADLHQIDSNCELIVTPIEIGNIATSEHAVLWQKIIEDYGKDIAKSSLLHNGKGFVIRMHMADHPPPHIHIYRHIDDRSTVLAKIRIDTGDLFYGQLSAAMLNEIREIIAHNKTTFMEGWARCRDGKLPVALDASTAEGRDS
jgi:hypothetical protein